MRIFNKIYDKFRFAGLLMLCVFLSGNIIAQEEEKVNLVEVTLKVTDENGTAIPNASVIVGEGLNYTNTDDNGMISFAGVAEDVVTIKAKGYIASVVSVGGIVKESNVKLIKSKLYMNDEDVVQLPFNALKRRYVTNSSTVISGDKLSSYPSIDIRNTLTGLVPGVEVAERSGAPGLQAQESTGRYSVTDKVALNSRGQSMDYMVDGIPVDIAQMPLDPDEIESVTVLKDIVAKAMFGPSAADGIIYITTKRGVKNARTLNVNIESGVKMIDRFPEWVSGTDYAKLHNQALINSGLPAKYSDADIAAYGKNDPYDMYHPNINFREMMLKNNAAFRRVGVSSNGGNNAVQYHAYLGYNNEGDIYKIGATADYNRVNTRSNIDIKINDFLKVKFDFYGALTYRQSPNYGFNTNYTNEDGNVNTVINIHEFTSVVNDISNVPPIAFPLHTGFDETAKTPWYGVSSNFGYNPVGDLMGNGYYNEQTRTGASNVALDYDMGAIIKGLKSRTYLGINILNLARLGKAENYIAYIPKISQTAGGADTVTLVRDQAHTGFDMTEQVKMYDFYAHNYKLFQNFTFDRTFGNHDIQSSLTYFISKVILNDTEEPRRLQNGVWSTNYAYRNKYILQGVLNYAGTYAFDKGKRFEMFPAVGAAWVISEEGFMSNMKAINYLKLRAEYGKIGYENFMSPFRYRDDWNTGTGAAFGPVSNAAFPSGWLVSTYANDNTVNTIVPGRIGNPNLTWEQRKEFNIGLDALLLNEKLEFEVTYYNNLRDGVVSQLANTLPFAVGISGARPFYNYNTVRFTGVELGLQYTGNAGDFCYSIGGNASFQKSEVIKYDVPNYRNSYQTFIGKSLGTIMGQTYLGKFATDEETTAIPQLFDESLKAGDLKYQDINGDGFVDDSDASRIGDGTPKLLYAVNAHLKYKNFDLNIIGTGRAFYDVVLNSKYFWNGWGNNTYSAFVRDNVGGDYPRLTYYKVNNNFVTSSYWMRDGSFFKIQNVELGYTFKASSLQRIKSRGIRIYVRGANLLTISKIKDVDPEYLSSGIYDYPLYRTFTGGVKLTF